LNVIPGPPRIHRGGTTELLAMDGWPAARRRALAGADSGSRLRRVRN